MTSFEGFQGIKVFLYAAIPSIMKMLNIQLSEKSTAKFFSSIITESIKIRKENNIVRPDMIHLLLEAQSKESKNITNEDILSQAMVDEILVHFPKMAFGWELYPETENLVPFQYYCTIYLNRDTF